MVLAVLLMFSLALSLWGSATLGFDLDEMATGAWVLSRDLGDLFQQIGAVHEGNAFGYPVFIYFWGKISQSTLWLRLPSLLAATATIALFYRRFSRESRAAAFLAALLLSLSTLWLTHAQNARCYTLFAFFSFSAFLLHEKMEANPKQRSWNFLFVLASLFSLSLHHFSVLYLAPLWFPSAVAVAAKKAPVSHLTAPAAAVLFYLPQIAFLQHQWQFGPQWIPVVSVERLTDFTKNFFFVQHAVPTVVTISLIVYGAIRSCRSQPKLLAWTFFPILTCLVISYSTRSLLVERYFIPSLLGAFACVAVALGDLLTRLPKTLTAIPVSAAGLIAIIQLPSFFAQAKDADFRGAAAFLQSHDQECGSKIVTDLRLVRRWPYYLPKAEISGWGTQLPSRPYWLIQAGYELPEYIRPTFEGAMLHWRGRNAIAACIK